MNAISLYCFIMNEHEMKIGCVLIFVLNCRKCHNIQ